MRALAVLLTALALLVAAGCGGDNGDDAAAPGTETTAPETEGEGQTIQVSAREFAFDPPDLTAEPGELTLELTNDGEFPHAIEVEGGGVEESSDEVAAGESTSLTVSLEEGTYRIYCPVGDHEARGMVGTLTVGSGGGAAAATETESETHSTTHEETGETETESDDDDSGSGY